MWRTPRNPAPLVGGLATAVGAIKVSQPHAWLYVLRYRPRAAIGGALVAAALVAVTLALTGIGLWFDWVAQLRLAGDPTWDLGGFAIVALPADGCRLCRRRRLSGGGLVRPARASGRLDRRPLRGRVAVAPHLRAAVPRARDAPHPARGGPDGGDLHRDLLVRGRVGGDPGLAAAMAWAERGEPDWVATRATNVP